MLAAGLLGSCGGGDGDQAAEQPASPGTTSAGGSAPVTKVADSLVQMADRVRSARTQGVVDLSRLSNDIVHVRADGAIEVSLHASSVVSTAEVTALRRLGGEVVTTAAAPNAAGGLVQAWVPWDRLAEVAALPWVGAVTPPSYGTPGG